MPPEKTAVRKDQSGSSLLMFIFLVVGVVATFAGIVLEDNGINEAVREARQFFLYGLFFLVSALSPEKRQIKRIVGYLFASAVLVSLLVLLVQVAGGRLPFIAGKIESLSTGHSIAKGVMRVTMPGVPTLNLAFLLSFFLLIKRFSVTVATVFFFVAFGFLLSFTRGAWLGSVLSILVVLPFVDKSIRKALLRYGFLIAVMASMVLVMGSAGWFGDRLERYATGATERFQSMAPGKMQADQSFQYRAFEAKRAMERIWESPVIGHGLGAIAQKVYWKTESGRDETLVTGYIHNGYVNLLFKMGFIGLLAFVLLMGTFCYTSLTKLKHIQDEYLKSVHIGGLCFVISNIPQAFVNPTIMEGKSIINIAVAMGLCVLAVRADQQLRLRSDG